MNLRRLFILTLLCMGVIGVAPAAALDVYLDHSLMVQGSPGSVVVYGYGRAYGYFGPWVDVEVELDGNGERDYATAQGSGEAYASVFLDAEPDMTYRLSVSGCAEWDSYYDCEWTTETITTDAVPPLIEYIDPSSGPIGQCREINVFGDNLDNGSLLSSDWFVNVTTSSAYYNQISGTVCVDSGAPPWGTVTIRVQTSVGTSNGKTFTVTP